MNCSYFSEESIIKDYNIYIRKFSGSVNLNDLISIWQKMLANSEESSAYPKRLLDLSQCDIEIDKEAFELLISKMLLFSEQISKYHLAVVSNSPLATAFSQIADKKLSQNIKGLRISVFSSKEAALEWLKLY